MSVQLYNKRTSGLLLRIQVPFTRTLGESVLQFSSQSTVSPSYITADILYIMCYTMPAWNIVHDHKHKEHIQYV
jgi:hypothetical protein